MGTSMLLETQTNFPCYLVLLVLTVPLPTFLVCFLIATSLNALTNRAHEGVVRVLALFDPEHSA